MSDYTKLFPDIRPVFLDYPKFKNSSEILLYGFIYGMTFNGDGECCIPNQVLANKCKITRPTFTSAINRLIDNGLIEKITHSGNCVGYKALVSEKEMEQDMKRLIDVKPGQTQEDINKQTIKDKYKLNDKTINRLFEWSNIPRKQYHVVPKITSKSFVTNKQIIDACKQLQKLDDDLQLRLIDLCISNNWCTIKTEMLNNNKSTNVTKPKSQSINRGDVNYDD